MTSTLVTMQIPILHQDDAIVVVDKPAGLPVKAAPGDPYAADALHASQAQLGLAYLNSPQWLTAEASGVLLFGTQQEAKSALAELFARRTTEITYLALVYGTPAQPTGVIDAPLARDAQGLYRVTTAKDKRGQRAITRYRVLETAPDKRFSLVEAIPETGNSDQVRVHLTHLGSPVVGDPIYRAAEMALKSMPGGSAAPIGRPPTGKPGPSGVAPRLGLHAHRLTLRHPATGEPVTFTAPPPAFFARLATGLPELALAATKHIRKVKPGAAGLAGLIDLALARRAPLVADPHTTLYRLINGAADGLAGLTVDRYGDALVVGIYDEEGRPDPLAPGLIERLAQATDARALYVKYRQQQASRVEEEALPALAPAKPVWGPALGEYPAHEDGLAYLVRPGEGWNPGIFADMREMRGRVRAWAAGKRVLNCFAYTCGFGVAALAGGAERAVNLDVSWPALERGRANYRANGFAPAGEDFLYGDTFDLLPRLAREHALFDIVILDPPGFARTKTHTFSASQDYSKLARAAAQVIAPNGLLIACCNVADLSWHRFRDRVVVGLDEAWRAAEIVGVYQAPALDFPSLPDRESHLKLLVARLA